MSNNSNKPLVISCIKTDKGCFISDCRAVGGYDYDYHRTNLTNLFFDGKHPTPTYQLNWFYIEQYPTSIQREVTGVSINERYELIDESLESDKMPRVIPYEEEGNYNNSVIENLYSYRWDEAPSYMEDVDCDIQVICELDNYTFPPRIEYPAMIRENWSDRCYTITNAQVTHQMLDKIIFPSVLLHERPCMFTSKQMYDITRKYILDHIDNSVAKVTSNYEFCFEVKKIISLAEPETVTYRDIFAKTKRERNKTHTFTKTFEEKLIFEMTHDQDKYRGYSVIPAIQADTEAELKEKVDAWLEGLMEIINEPLCKCPNCLGTGYTNKIKKEGFSYATNKD